MRDLPDYPFRTLREAQLERRVAELERENHALQFARDRFVMVDLRQEPTPYVKLPKYAEVHGFDEDPRRGQRPLGIMARVWGSKPFGLTYYLSPGLLTTGDAAQVLTIAHGQFLQKLLRFVEDRK